MNKMKVSVGILVLFLVVLVGACFSLYQKNKTSCETKSESRGLSLIDNEYTKNLNKLPDGWKVYKNAEYGFQINYPEMFDGQQIKIGTAEFSNQQELNQWQQNDKVSDNASFLVGYAEGKKEMIDFGVFKENQIFGDTTYNISSSLFAITIYPNDSNLSLKDFVSNEIMNTPEGIDDQRIVNIGGRVGYRIIITRGVNSAPSVVAYYLPTNDNKKIIGISSPIEIFQGGYGPNFEFEGFIRAYPKYEGNLQDMNNILTIEGNQEGFDAKYPEYESYIEDLAARSAKKELNKRLTFEQIAYSFVF